MLNPYHVVAKRPHRATIIELDPKPGRAPQFWEVSKPLITGPRSRFASLADTWHIEFPDPDKRETAERLFEAMLAAGVVLYVMPLKAHA